MLTMLMADIIEPRDVGCESECRRFADPLFKESTRNKWD